MATDSDFTATNDTGSSGASDTTLDAVEDIPVAPAAETTETKTQDRKAEEAVGAKMKEILARNEHKNQKDELEETGMEGVNNPDGDNPDETKSAVGKDDDEQTEEVSEVEEKETPEQKARAETLEAFDPNLKRVAKDLGNWKQEDIDEFIVANPTLARITFSNMAAGYNNLSLQYAQAARLGAQNPAQQARQAVATPQATTNVLDDLLANPAKLKSLQDVAGQELTDLFIKPLLAERAAINEDRQFISGLRKEALVREINSSIEGLALSGFQDFYGKTGETTQDQHNNRFRVGQVADQIRSGAQFQGVSMSIKEALERAHLIVTADQTRAQARKEVTKQVQRRATQITARPSGRKQSAPATARGDDAAMAAVEGWFSERGV